ncbi:MAG: prohibitin family protein [Pseudomonadales bacterium]|nr:prohibitin family protein [Pseudomonadales bacterium]
METLQKSNALAKVIPSSIFFILLVISLFSSWYTIDQGERGVILRNGAVLDTADPGLHFKLPVIDRVIKMSVQSRVQVYERMEAYSRDQQPAEMRVSVNYRMNAGSVAEIYENYGSEKGMTERLIDRKVYQEVKTVFGQFNAVAAIQERERLNHTVQEAIAESVQGSVTVESVQIENIDFSNSYEQSIEQRMLAEVEVQKVMQNLEREKVQAEIVRTKAQAEADARLARAEADAKSIALTGQAEAEAIAAKAAALKNNPEFVGLVQAEKWNGVLPSTMVPESTLPMLEMKK